MTLPLILSSDPETPLSDLLHPFDRYDLALGLEAIELLPTITRALRDAERMREALEDIGIYGCGMLNQPAALNGPNEQWLEKRIARMEQVARQALGDNT